MSSPSPTTIASYPVHLLSHIAERFAGDPGLDGVTGRAEDASGRSAASWSTQSTTLTDGNLWNRAISFTIFLRRNAVERVGTFDERLGLGSSEAWSSGEEIDYLIRAVRGGARIEYDPSLVVKHDVRVDDAKIGLRDGASVGYLLRKHRYPPANGRANARTAARGRGRLARPSRPCTCVLLRGDVSRPNHGIPGPIIRCPMTTRRWTIRRIASGAGRRMPLRPLRIIFPFKLWRGLFRLWLATIRAQPNGRKAMQEFLEVYADAYYGMDRGAIAYDGGVHVKHRLTHYHDFFVERIRPGDRVLDVGCGKGELAYDIAERAGATVVAIDRASWALAFARSHFAHPSVTYVESDALAYQVDDAFEVAILSNVLEHIGPRVELLRSLRTEARARRLLIRVPMIDRDWVVPLRRELGLPYFSDPEHEVEYTPELLSVELDIAGWKMDEPRLVWGEIWVEATPAAEHDSDETTPL